jgi:acyl-CoA thioester hydrolase
MAKPDAALLNPARYPFTCTIETRFGDLDVNKHINNVAMAGMVEEGRVRFHHASGFVAGLEGRAAMVASLSIEFLGQAYHPAPITVHAGAARIGRTSYALDLLLMQEGRVVVFAQTVVVCTDAGGPAEISQAFRTSAQDWMVRA